MAHWFHRSLLKSTTVVKFDKILSGGLNHCKLASDLKKARDRLLELLPDPAHEMETMNTAYILYMSLMAGFLADYPLGGNKELRHSIEYKWTHTLLGQGAQANKDAAYDMANMSINVAIWHMKHASFISAKPSVNMDDAKEIHTSLRRAAGIFQMVRKDILPSLDKNTKPGNDLDHRVLTAFINQCTAEAQEVTVARAIELKHNKSLVSALATETGKMFEEAARQLKDIDKNITEQWKLYLTIKRNIYLAYAYCYFGHNLLDENNCGVAISALRESEKHYKLALELCKPYSKVKGPAKPVKPQGHSFFTKVNSMVSLTLEKCERENGFIYHQKVPADPPDLETKATYGLASPEEYNIPPVAPLWQIAADDDKSLRQAQKPPEATPADKPTTKDPEKPQEELPVVKEAKAASEKSDDHGCVVQ